MNSPARLPKCRYTACRDTFAAAATSPSVTLSTPRFSIRRQAVFSRFVRVSDGAIAGFWSAINFLLYTRQVGCFTLVKYYNARSQTRAIASVERDQQPPGDEMTDRSCAANLVAAPILHGNMRSSAQKRRRAVLAATIGNTIEWYDFLVYSFMSVTIAKLFFPTGSELTSLFLSIATFGVGVAIRPIGAVALGIYADDAIERYRVSIAVLIPPILKMLAE